jgi:ABC-2 type transport system permease protein
MRNIWIVLRRELLGYFSTPVAYVFLCIFLAAAAALPFLVGGFFERRQADLSPFFAAHPWLFLVLVPAIGMRLWAEERRSGTIEVLLTLPITIWQAVLGKFLAGWIFIGLALALTFPIWITVNYLGEPDNGVIFASYLGSLLMAGAFLAVTSAVSASTSSQVIAFVLSVAAGFLMLLTGVEFVLAPIRRWVPQYAVDVVESFSFLTHFSNITTGVLDARGLVFFVSTIALLLYASRTIIELTRA